MATELTRRQMLIMSALAAAAFTPVGRALGVEALAKGPVDAGSLSKFQEEAIYPEFESKGFFIIHQGSRVFAQTAICTHKGCKLTAYSEGFKCKCHGSMFTIDGKVTKSPAKKDLSRFAVSVNDAQNLMVDLSKQVSPSEFDSPGAYVQIKPKA